MLSRSNVALGFIQPCAPTPVGRITSHGGIFSRATHGLWMALGDANLVPDFNSEDPGRPPIAHPKLQQRISELKQLPSWRSGFSPPEKQVFNQIKAQKHFTKTLGEARILAQELHSMWGDTDALSLLQLAGPKLIIDAYDQGDRFALSACAAVFTLIEADHALRARLGNVVVDEMQMVDVLSQIHFSDYNDVVLAVPSDGSQIPDKFPTAISSNEANRLVLHVQINHPELKSATLLADVARLYQNKRVLAWFGIEDIAVLLNEPLSQHHLASYFTLIDGPFRHVCDSIEAMPEPAFPSLDWGNCKYAFEQCCRHFGEDFMLETTFGQHPSTTHKTLFNDRLMKILPVLQRFLMGEETSWS